MILIHGKTKNVDVPLRPGFLLGKFDIYSESDVYYDRIEQPDPWHEIYKI